MRAIPRRGVGILAALAIIAVLAVPKLIQLRKTSAPATAPAKKTLRVRAHRVVPTQLIERLATTGTVRANEEVEIVSEISGKISAIHFREGSQVASGQLLLKIDDSELLADRLDIPAAGRTLPLLKETRSPAVVVALRSMSRRVGRITSNAVAALYEIKRGDQDSGSNR